jgi:hypothetical protein
MPRPGPDFLQVQHDVHCRHGRAERMHSNLRGRDLPRGDELSRWLHSLRLHRCGRHRHVHRRAPLRLWSMWWRMGFVRYHDNPRMRIRLQLRHLWKWNRDVLPEAVRFRRGLPEHG